MEITPLKSWLPHEKPLIMAGPCSLESEDQICNIAMELAKNPQIKVLRAGIWKPRTRPNTFEGLGAIALPWLKNAKKVSGLLTATEVATPKHVELALKNEVDILWIGARTSANPFSVQEIADSLKGVDIPVMVKNPINADLQLWIGALERFSLANIKKLVAIHRGFSVAHKMDFRNDPIWKIPVELKYKFPGLPLICDPSHITGDRQHIFKVAQKAMDFDMDGLIIETHNDPDKAWSDAAQQITPNRLNEILCELKIKSTNCCDKSAEQQLEILRESIDRVDHEILEALSLRKEIVEKIAFTKKQQNVTALQLNRFQDLMNDRLVVAKKFGLDENLVKEIFDTIHEESLKIQTEIFESNYLNN